MKESCIFFKVLSLDGTSDVLPQKSNHVDIVDDRKTGMSPTV